MQTLTILYRDDHFVAIDKPAGLLVHRSKVDVYAREFALQMLRDQIGQPVFPVHRIDRPTSGVLLFALNKDSARAVSAQFADREVSKMYLAIVRGRTAKTRHWDEPLVEKQDRATDAKARKDKPAQSAITEYRTLESWTVPFSAGKYPQSRYSLVEARPLTGRKHQLRRHFNHMANPIVGDTTYGDRRHNRLFREQFGVMRLLLVAKAFSFVHPVTDVVVDIEADPGVEFEQALSSLRQHAIESNEEV
ncbi:pseudouridine synthase [Mariniblastus fucicola]|uniref:tRNA pseudouridine synthase C n=1 Tax=Mariniblastus fucicola TaxID=980251 RepID=A0A5B9PLS7_9BACT|nr:pseudouridine synthase [Mariniblastus fucicola]QEG23631.1 tRNA pseudouridine synthase C [Mariniblastus fucicola]